MRSVWLLLLLAQCMGQDWPPPNTVDEIRQRMDAITAENCKEAAFNDLRLSKDTVSHLPNFVKLNYYGDVITENRTSLALAHNLALRTGIFMSFMNHIHAGWEKFSNQTDWLYYYTSAWADSTVSDDVQQSAFYYDQNTTYANWYYELPFNMTLPLYGPRVWQTGQGMSQSTDQGAGGGEVNYTQYLYKTNPWYSIYLPDNRYEQDYLTKQTSSIRLKYAGTEATFGSFVLPLLPYDENVVHMPVTFTQPYFDCGMSDHWVVGATSPFVDRLPRYLAWDHMRRDKFSGISVVQVDYDTVDINQCPLSIGNEGPNYFQSTAMCKPSTYCEPLAGFGLQRGGYQCHCKPGLTYPPGQSGPYQGVDIEKATQEEYENGFDCILPRKKIIHEVWRELSNWIGQLNEPAAKGTEPRKRRQRHLVSRYAKPYAEVDKPVFDKEKYEEIKFVLSKMDEYPYLDYSYAYGAPGQFIIQAAMTERLARFLSSYLQNIQTETLDLSNAEKYYRQTRPDKNLHADHIYGEVLAMVMADPKIYSTAVYFDEWKFHPEGNGARQFFAPIAVPTNAADYSVFDYAEVEPLYTEEQWFQDIKTQWENNTFALTKHEMVLNIRSNVNGDEVTTSPRSPMTYYSPTYDTETWSAPHNRMTSFAVPFFGLNEEGSAVEFHGVVKTDVYLDKLHIDQCDNSPYNAYRNTALCDLTITKCVSTREPGLHLGNYKCVCLRDTRISISGKDLQQHYDQLQQGLENQFHELHKLCQN